MGKWKYTQVEEYGPVILQMREAGKTLREIAGHLGMTKRQVEQWGTCYNRRQRKLATGIVSNSRGRPRQRPLSREEEYEKEIASTDGEPAAAGFSAVHIKKVKPKAKCHVICPPGPVPSTDNASSLASPAAATMPLSSG